MALYDDYEVKPYVSAKRDLATEVFKPVPRRNMELLADDLLAGDIILLWRIRFGTFTNETSYSKYFEYTYGIDGPARLQTLIEKGYVYEESAFESLDHISATVKRQLLKTRQIAGLSKMKVADLDQALRETISESELANCFSIRGYALSPKGQKALDDHPQIVARHPQKRF